MGEFEKQMREMFADDIAIEEDMQRREREWRRSGRPEELRRIRDLVDRQIEGG